MRRARQNKTTRGDSDENAHDRLGAQMFQKDGCMVVVVAGGGSAPVSGGVEGVVD
jgi:hypothetical protein